MDGCPRLRESGGFHSLLHGVRRALISVCAPGCRAPGLCPGPRPCAGSARGASPSGLLFPPAGGTGDFLPFVLSGPARQNGGGLAGKLGR
ncbi:hypothetical protein D7X33_03795 [Butyricicoccus sp. 1XD8-22]|nr:hypothetical protein D7X33_03795 [Butyricicoccus sp. 1XD8-22]